jgi:hypothetical protein
MVKAWLGLHSFDPASWMTFNDINSWWLHIVHDHPRRRKAIASLVMLVSWELWNERNARFFNNKSSMALVVLARIKSEARSWVFTGAKYLVYLIPGD